jgi:hypothetical protein
MNSYQHLSPEERALIMIEYMNMIDLLRQFITAERSGHWLLHLKSLQQMLPYLAASGHNLYVKSSTLC